MRSFRWGGVLGALVLLAGMGSAFGGAASTQDFSDLKKEVEDLRARLAQKSTAPQASGPIGRADALVGNKYGPNAAVTTKDGRLTIGGLIQVWAYSIQNDNVDYVADNLQTNELSDNDGYRVRRAELKFSLDITSEITAVITIDPTGGDEANTYPGLPSNQGVVGKGWLSGGSSVTFEQLHQWLEGNESIGFVARHNMGSGFVLGNRLLQDAYINYHSDIIPHHDFTLGQFKPPMGEEGNRNSGQLDFVERAMISQFSNQRDLGIMVHGTWWDDRFQYWIGGFNSAGTFHNTFASMQNRSDDNDAKDLAWKLLLRPVWKDEKWGSLELGYSRQDGVHGESGDGFDFGLIGPSTDGLSLKEARANRQYAWVWYRPGGPVRGWWLRGEWGQMADRPLPGGGATLLLQQHPGRYGRDGWYAGTGYRLSDSIWSEKLKGSGNWIIKALNDVELAYRYETFGNILVEDAVNSNRTDVFKTVVHTFGLNYYWKGYNVRTQVNYLIVDEQEGNAGHNVSTGYSLAPGGKRVREVNNNVLVISQQVQW